MMKIGDVFSIQTAKGQAYFQYMAKNKLMGTLIRVLPGIYTEDLLRSELDVLVEKNTNFWVFFPVLAALKKNIIVQVENFPIPEHARMFPTFRTGVPNEVGRVEHWSSWDGDNSIAIGSITEEQRKMPIREIWNDARLINRIEQGWLPEKDTR